MGENLVAKTKGIHLKGGQIPEGKYNAFLQGKTGYDNSYMADCDCIDCGDCDCDDCPI